MATKPLKEREFQFVYICSLLSNTRFLRKLNGPKLQLLDWIRQFGKIFLPFAVYFPWATSFTYALELKKTKIWTCIQAASKQLLIPLQNYPNTWYLIFSTILFPSISSYFHIPKIFSIFFLTLEKIGIDEKVICYHNISN